MRSRLLIAAFILDAVCAVAAPFAMGLFPNAAEAAESSNHFLVFSDGHCYELTQLDTAHWQIEGEADIAACQAMNGE